MWHCKTEKNTDYVDICTGIKDYRQKSWEQQCKTGHFGALVITVWGTLP